MAAPVVTVVLNKVVFNPGEAMTLTATYSDPDTKPAVAKVGTVTVVVTDAEGHASAPVTMAYTINTPGVDLPGTFTVTVTDPDRVWVKVSDTGNVAVYTSVA